MKIGCTSYTVPGTYGENIRFIAGDRRFNRVRHIQLLCYFWDEETRQLLSEERGVILDYRDRFSYSVHLPDSLGPSHADIVAETADYCGHYDLHPQEGNEDEIAGVLRHLVDAAGGPDRFFLENLIDRDTGPTERALMRFARTEDGTGAGAPHLCVDTGHLLMRGEDPAKYCAQRRRMIRQIHLHGMTDGTDHHPFGAGEPWFTRLVPFLSTFEGTVICEVFSVDDTLAVIEALASIV